MVKKIEEAEVEVLGHTVELRRVQNPRLIKAIVDRKPCFLFNYGDHSDGHTEHSEDYSDYSDYDDVPMDTL